MEEYEEWNELVYSAKFSFEPVGETPLCRDAAGVNFVSDFASEWNREFIGAPK
jgi:hypothetical protein